MTDGRFDGHIPSVPTFEASMTGEAEAALWTHADALAWLEDQGGFWLASEFQGTPFLVVGASGRSAQAVIEGADERAALVRAVWALRTKL
jgi:hypothetical protein